MNFSPSIFPTFRAQAKALLAAEDFTRIEPAPEAAANIEALTRAGNVEQRTRGWWLGSMRSVKKLLISRALWNLFAAFVTLGSVLLMQELVKGTYALQTYFWFAFGIGICEVIRRIVNYYDAIRGRNINRGVQAHLMGCVNDKLLVLDPQAGEEFSRGNLKTLVSSDVEAIEDFVSAASHSWIPTFCMIGVLAPVIISSLGWLGALGLIMAIVQLPIAFLLARFVGVFQNKAQAEKDALTTMLGEWVRNIRLIRFLGQQEPFRKDIHSIVKRYGAQAALLHMAHIVMYGVSGEWWMFVLASMVIAAEVWSVPMDLVSFLPSCWALLYLMSHFSHLPYSISMYAQAKASQIRIKQFLSTPDLLRHFTAKPEPATLGVPVRLHLEQVTLQYGERSVIDNLSLRIDLGMKNAIIGLVGSGKTSLLDLLTGEKHPTSGSIEVEFSSGIRAPLWNREVYEEYRKSLAYSPQQPYLSNAKFHQNISLDENYDKERLEAAVNHAQLQPDIALLTHGLEEEVGETGINLSGGQKQRVSLGRAFYADRKIFVLDDPLSAVDRNTETLLMESILAQTSGLILVSHRLDELQACDRVLVLEQGKVIEDGSPKTLAADNASRFAAYISALAQNETPENSEQAHGW